MNSLFSKIKRFYYWNYTRYASESNVLIYQMGKVGSTSLEKAIEESLHFHTLYVDNYPCKTRLKGLYGVGLKGEFKKLSMRLGYFLRRRAIKSRRHIKVITLVRAPLERNISMFFQDIDAYLFSAYSRIDGSEPLSTREHSTSVLADIFNARFEHSYPLNWFDREFKRFFGINVYDYTFDKEKGVGVWNRENVSIICFELSKLHENKALLESFLGKQVNLERSNDGDNKWYSEAYKTFKSNYLPSNDIKELMASSKFSKYFY
ncbi:putative capsular polysaccharide synthesis family protein [Thalassotalea euphylliae]|uniref:putative capsular polysaccharide synthesis family protein n=1 Tax=Thalassotalea euphylliae TaxID=1655234 RepID=UPI003628FDFD